MMSIFNFQYSIFKFLFPFLTWNIPSKVPTLYLTFDDGPIPEVTPWVLDLLEQYNATATFFCVGDNAKKYPGLMKRLNESGHSTGNHTMHHLNGFVTKNKNYFTDVDECKKYVHSEVFRPPYGKIKFSQIYHLKNKFRIIMWDVLSKDYDLTMTGEQCFDRVKKFARSGSIIVFHDSLKAEERLRYVLPETLKYFSKNGFRFSSIS
jgi:peptidoglycan/xylan/chitin deacetylase (PgdA/CDA1 family)